VAGDAEEVAQRYFRDRKSSTEFERGIPKGNALFAHSESPFATSIETMKNPQFSIFTALLIATAFTVGYGQSKGDYLILSSPLEYTIFNEYKESLSAAENGAFLPFSPLLVIDRELTLGDQITKALQFEFQRKTYYLLKGDKGGYVGEKSRNGRHIYKGCQQLDDTVEVIGRGITVSCGSGDRVALEKGTRLNRIFKSGDRFYVLTLGSGRCYGWSSLEPRSAWRRNAAALHAESTTEDTIMPQNLKERIREKITAANDAYKVYFTHFNSLTKEEKSAPAWRYECSGSRIRCELTGPAATGDQLAESTQSLVQELENVLLGSPFAVHYANRELIIERRVVQR
jgi:hypothetical protein